MIKCLLVEMKDNDTNPNNFVATIVKKEIFAFVIMTLQMTQTLYIVESNIEMMFYVQCLHLTPSMIVMFLVHSLHMVKWAFGFSSEGSSKRTSPLNMIGINGTFQINNLL